MKMKDTKVGRAATAVAQTAKELGSYAVRHPVKSVAILFAAYKLSGGADAVLAQDTASVKTNNAIVRQMNDLPDYNRMLDTLDASAKKTPKFELGGKAGVLNVSSAPMGEQSFIPLDLSAKWNMSPSANVEVKYSSLWKGSPGSKIPAGEDTTTSGTRSQGEVRFSYKPIDEKSDALELQAAGYIANNSTVAGLGSEKLNGGGRLTLNAHTRYLGPVSVGVKVEGGLENQGGNISQDLSVAPRIGVYNVGKWDAIAFDGGSFSLGAKLNINHGTLYDTYGYSMPYNARVFYTARATVGFFESLKLGASAEAGVNHSMGQLTLTSHKDNGRKVTLGVQYLNDQTPVKNVSLNGIYFTFSMTTD
ncbi:Uncharacterised protein [uncultured archaeon]|nr:Uncharacterised protein [uncultured archaeon]